MTKLEVLDRVILGAEVGPENPLPAMGSLSALPTVEAGPGIPATIRENLTYGLRANPLPYTIQDGYHRNKHEMRVKTLVLENDFLRATFLPQYGGRLWSLYDKVADRDLVYENPVIQPANLAIRNAWLSGGVEWNIGLRGHSPFTCSDVFAARIEGSDGSPILRMYEFERIRQVPFQIDCWLPPDSSMLYVFVRILNTNDHEVPMYWWSNIAYPEHPGTRVVVPAARAYRFGYGKKGLSLLEIPRVEGVDVSYSVNLGHSADFFFDIPDGDRKWIAAVDQDGKGLFQASTDRLIGRKLFVWGNGPGGHAWQEFLSVPGRPYLEIQAGLAHTQMEHLPMPAGAEWSWLEAYGGVEVDPDGVHRDTWERARASLSGAIERIAARSRVDERYDEALAMSRNPIQELLHEGSGWGHLESRYRAEKGIAPLCGQELDFGTTLRPAERQWLDLLDHGTFPEPAPLDTPVGYDVTRRWQALLESYCERQPGNWYALLHLGLMHFERGDSQAAESAWKASARAVENPWALRNLSRLMAISGDDAAAAEYYERAFGLLPTCNPLTVEYGTAILRAGHPERWLTVHDSLPEAVRQTGRFQLLYAQALLEAGRHDAALAVIRSEPEVTDLREGENSLTEIWYRIHEQLVVERGEAGDGDVRTYVESTYPPPARIDFRMRTGKTG